MHPRKSWVPPQDEEAWCTEGIQLLTTEGATFSNSILTSMFGVFLGFIEYSHVPSHMNLLTKNEKFIRLR